LGVCLGKRGTQDSKEKVSVKKIESYFTAAKNKAGMNRKIRVAGWAGRLTKKTEPPQSDKSFAASVIVSQFVVRGL